MATVKNFFKSPKNLKTSRNYNKKQQKNHQTIRKSPNRMEQQKDVRQTLNASFNSCSSTRCFEDEREDRLLCCECKNSYHYQCTMLPAYQIQAYISKRSKRYYYCQNCITVSPEVERLVNPPTKEQQEIKRLR